MHCPEQPSGTEIRTIIFGVDVTPTFGRGHDCCGKDETILHQNPCGQFFLWTQVPIISQSRLNIKYPKSILWI